MDKRSKRNKTPQSGFVLLITEHFLKKKLRSLGINEWNGPVQNVQLAFLCRRQIVNSVSFFKAINLLIKLYNGNSH